MRTPSMKILSLTFKKETNMKNFISVIILLEAIVVWVPNPAPGVAFGPIVVIVPDTPINPPLPPPEINAPPVKKEK